MAMVKLLLDESVPKGLAGCLPDRFHTDTAPKMGWSGLDNGELLSAASAESFTALITADQNMEYQQNTKNLPLALIVLIARSNRVEDLRPLVPDIIRLIDAGIEKQVYQIRA